MLSRPSDRYTESLSCHFNLLPKLGVCLQWALHGSWSWPDPNFDQEPSFQAHSRLLEVLEDDFEPDEDPNEGSDTSEVHPCLETSEDSGLKIPDQGSLHIGIEGPDSVNVEM